MSARTKKLNFNLIIQEKFGDSVSEQLLSWALSYGRYIIIITQITVLSVFFMRFKLDRDHTDLKESVSQKQAIIESISDLETEIRSTQQKLSDIAKISNNQHSIPHILTYLQDNTPTDTVYKTLSISGERIYLVASTPNLKSFSYLLMQLQMEDRFREVTLEDIGRRTDGMLEFRISAKINTQKFT